MLFMLTIPHARKTATSTYLLSENISVIDLEYKLYLAIVLLDIDSWVNVLVWTISK